MSFQPKKFNDIFEDMRKRTSVITDFETGSVARTLYESFAYEIALLYEKMQLVYLSAYVDTAEGQQLDMAVAILGIKRGLPDFAEGEVTFQRDIGNQDISIPQGTLVATVDTPTTPKKVYQTGETALFRKDQTSVMVKVQAVNRGETEVTPADTLVVLPRPIVGIKSVANAQKTDFTGKHRETDAELRSRAKNALIASGKATLLSIENALLSLPEVKDVKVWEKFRYARGTVTLSRLSGSDPLEVPKGTVLTATYTPELTKPEQQIVRSFTTTERKTIAVGETSVEVAVQAQAEGQAGELTAIGSQVTWVVEGSLATLTVSNAKAIELGDFGVVEVFVDCDDFDTQKPQLETELDRVRAAGIFTRLQSAIPLKVDGIFQITTPSDLKFSSAEERRKLEQTVETAITAYINELRMGQPLLFAQIFKRVLSISNVTNLEEFVIQIEKQQEGKPTTEEFKLTNKQIEADVVERFQPNHIYVASGTKDLLVNIQFQADNLTGSVFGSVTTSLKDKFKLLNLGDSIKRSAIKEEINKSTSNLNELALRITIHHWYQADSEVSKLADVDDPEIKPSFVEKITLGELFAYSKVLKIIGALKIQLPASVKDQEKQEIYKQIGVRISNYIETLKPEEDILLDKLIELAASVNPVAKVDLNPKDFQISIDDSLVDRLLEKDKKIDVQAFEKAQLGDFCISSTIEPVQIVVNSVQLEAVVNNPTPQEFNEATLIDSIKQAVGTAINTFFTNLTSGQSVIYKDLKHAIENQVPTTNYTVKELNLTATSLWKQQDPQAKPRVQNTAINKQLDFHIRSVESPHLNPLANGDIIDVTVNYITPPAPPP